MSESGEKGRWLHEEDINPPVIAIESEDALLQMKEKKPSEGIVVVHGNGGLLRDAPKVADFLRTECNLTAPLVYLSNDPVSSEDRRMFLDRGGDVVLSGHDQTLLPKMLTALQRRMRLVKEEREMIQPFDGLSIDPRRMQVSVHGRVVPLTAYEFFIMQLLAKRFPNAVPISDIIDDVYDGREQINSIHILIKRVRARIVPFSIISGRGRGYRLSETEKYVAPVPKRYRGTDASGNRLLALNERDRNIIEEALAGKTGKQIANELEIPREAMFRIINVLAGGMRRVSKDRLIAPSTPDGEWLYKKPPR